MPVNLLAGFFMEISLILSACHVDIRKVLITAKSAAKQISLHYSAF